MLAGGMAMHWLVIEKDVGPECGQESTLVHAPEEQRLIDSYVPGPQCPDDAFMSRHTTRSNQCSTDRRGVSRQDGLYLVQHREKLLERAAR